MKGVTQQPLIYGPNIKDWPEMNALTENILLVVAAKIMDPVTTTDELIPSGETSSFRSNPLGLAEFTLSRRDPEYVGRSKAIAAMEQQRVNGEDLYRGYPQLENIFSRLRLLPGQEHITVEQTEIGSMVYAVKPGDGSAREQAASCQRALGGLANICQEYATKRYRSNVINWGMLPLQMKQIPDFEVGDFIYIPAIKSALAGDLNDITAFVLSDKKPIQQISLYMETLTAAEQEIIKAGGLINYNKNQLTNSH